jgi:phosphoheptose isomerase
MIDSIIQHNIEHTKHCSENIERLAPLIAESASLICNALLHGKKILCYSPYNSMISDQFIYFMQQQFEHERPAFPCLNLSHLPLLHVFENINALSNEHDILILFDHPGIAFDLTFWLEKTSQQKIQSIICTHQTSHPMSEGIVLNILSDKDYQIPPIQLLLINTLCSIIDGHIFGYTGS